jgi:acyl carrier protein
MEEFIKIIKQELEIESNITENTRFKDLEEWDSMCALILSSLLSERYKVDIKPNEFQNYDTITDLYNKI